MKSDKSNAKIFFSTKTEIKEQRFKNNLSFSRLLVAFYSAKKECGRSDNVKHQHQFSEDFPQFKCLSNLCQTSAIIVKFKRVKTNSIFRKIDFFAFLEALLIEEGLSYEF